jgi:hypothetical protein
VRTLGHEKWLASGESNVFYKKILSRGEAVLHRSRYPIHSEEKGT